MRAPFRSVAWASRQEVTTPQFSSCGLVVEFVRSCHSGFWRFFAARPDVITPGRYFFVNDKTPHLSDFHYFGCEDWREGDWPRVEGHTHPVQLGNDKSLGWYWDNGKAPALAVPARSVGRPDQFDESQPFPVPTEIKLIGGIDSRCYLVPQGFLVRDFQELLDNNCAWLLILCGILEKMEAGDTATVEQVLRLIFGQGTTIDFRNPDADNNLYCVAQTPRNNIVILAGTHSWDLLARQIVQGMQGPTDYFTFGALPLHYNASTTVANFCNTAGMDATKPTLLVGHSMGAATAMTLWRRMIQANPDFNVRVITFGCPKPGDTRLVQAWRLQGQGVSVVNHGDPVARIPPSNTTRSAVQTVFPFIPDAWFEEWKPLHEYLHITEGGGLEFGPLDELSVAELLGFITFGLFMREEDPQTSHRMPSYIAHLKLKCPHVEAPFTADVYDLLFGHHEFAAGGGEFGGFGGVPANQAAALELGGAGLVTIPPGDSCETALELGLGEVYDGTTTNGDTQWFKVAIENGNTYAFTATVDTWGNWDADWYYGDDCATKTLILSQPTDFDPCVEHTATADQWIFIAISGSLFGDTDYSIVVDEGACP